MGAWVFALFFVFAKAAEAGPPPLEVYAALPKTEEVRLSPDGTMLAVVGTAGDQRILSVSKIDGGIVSKVALGDHQLSDLEWAGNDYVIIYFERKFLQAASVSVKDGSIKPIPRDSPDYGPRIMGRYRIASHDGHWYGYFGLLPTRIDDHVGDIKSFDQRYADLYKVDLETGNAERVMRGNQYERSWALSGDGQIIAQSEYDANTGNWRVFLPGALDTPIATGNSPYNFGFDGLSRTPGTALLRLGGEDGDIVELHLDSGRVENFLPAGKTTEFIHSRSTDLLLGAVLVDDNDSIMFDPTLDRHYKNLRKAFAGHRALFASVSDDLNRMILHVDGEDTAGTWQFVDFKQGKSIPIAEDYPEIPDAMIGTVKLIDYRASDGLALQGVLTLPPGSTARNLPLIVLPHDGPANNRARVEFFWLSQALAAQGYAVFQPNFRGSGGYGMAFRNAGFGQWGRKMQTDLSDGINALAAQGLVDPRRVCIVGTSNYGGYAALAGVTVQHGVYRCAVSYNGISNPRDLLKTEKEFDGRDTHRYGAPSMRLTLTYLGVESLNDPSLDAISPKLLAKSADAPILLIYEGYESKFHTDEAEDMASALERASKPVELLKLSKPDDSGPSFSDIRTQILKAIVAFVEKYNPPDTAAAH